MSPRLPNALPFSYFLQRSQVLLLYKSSLKAAQVVDDPDLRNTLKMQIKQEYRSKKHIVDTAAIRSLLAEGQRSLKQIKSMSTKHNSSDSWLSTDDVNDVRGRMGSGWPWSSSKK